MIISRKRDDFSQKKSGSEIPLFDAILSILLRIVSKLLVMNEHKYVAGIKTSLYAVMERRGVRLTSFFVLVFCFSQSLWLYLC